MVIELGVGIGMKQSVKLAFFLWMNYLILCPKECKHCLFLCIHGKEDIILMINFFDCRYDMEAIYFDKGVRTSKRQQLESKLLQVAPYFLFFGL
jgi:hypothetical protein